jgi:cytochrome c
MPPLPHCQPAPSRWSRRFGGAAARIPLFTAWMALAASGAYAQATAPKSWATCAACHSEAAGAIGPTLRGVVGRKAGAVAGFNYSKAMRNADITWDEQTLARFIGDPQKVVPGTRMPFGGIPDAAEAAAVARYLKDLR